VVHPPNRLRLSMSSFTQRYAYHPSVFHASHRGGKGRQA
jgi:hypothetical protein